MERFVVRTFKACNFITLNYAVKTIGLKEKGLSSIYEVKKICLKYMNQRTLRLKVFGSCGRTTII